MGAPNGLDDLTERVAVVEERTKAHDFAIGRLVSIGEDVKRLGERTSELGGAVKGLDARVELALVDIAKQLGSILERVGAVDTKAGAATAVALTAHAKAERASLTNEGEKKDDNAALTPDEKLAAEAGETLAVAALRGAKNSPRRLAVAFIVTVLASIFGGTRLQACQETQAPSSPGEHR